MPRTALMALALAGAGAGTAFAAPPARVVVPIRQTVFPNGVIRYSIPITIGRTHIEAMLDTGSTGIRVLPGTTQPGDVTPTTQPTTEHYGSGATLTGVIAHATVAVGGLVGAAPVPIAAIAKVGCGPKHPHCAAGRVSLQDYRIGSEAGGGFTAIVGISLAPARVVSPLPAIGAASWIVVLPRPGERAPGRLILNPDDADLAGFTRFTLDTTKTPYQALPGCVTDVTTRRHLCAPTTLDTGAPGINIKATPSRPPLRFRNGDRAEISFTGPGATLQPARFTVTSNGATHVKVAPPDTARSGAMILPGILPYFTYDVLYDSAHAVIGLRIRAAGRDHMPGSSADGP
jgi:hypothetical protein